MPITIALAIGFDPWLFEAQRAAWRSAGYFVTATGSIREAIGYFRGGDFDLVLLDQSIPVASRESLTAFIRTSGSLIPIYCPTPSSGNADDCAQSAIKDEPNALLQWIGELSTIQTRKPPANAAWEGDPDTLYDWPYRLLA
jgi:CheY-like chemotaxis protein